MALMDKLMIPVPLKRLPQFAAPEEPALSQDIAQKCESPKRAQVPAFADIVKMQISPQ
jgi:hypothetical protein